MKRFTKLCAAAGAMILLAGPAAVTAAAKSVCFPAYQIDHTEEPDDSTILFHMRNHKIYKASLINRCVGLKINTRGFTYEATDPGSDEICANLLTIKLNDTGEHCLVGDITLIEPPAKPAAPAQ